jgi:hypothetical protein
MIEDNVPAGKLLDDPRHFYADPYSAFQFHDDPSGCSFSLSADPDPAFYFSVYPDRTLHFSADPDPTLHFSADPDRAFHFTANPDSAPHQSDANLQPLVYYYSAIFPEYNLKNPL